ncbi:MAG: transglycosylase domain-containing protein [Muribaculaceae bacterium]|nr:transglycosylase domain-containing protein [Muribaculaceae bacterium]
MKQGNQNKNGLRRYPLITLMWLIFGCVVVGVFLLFVLIYNGVIGYMPPVEELKNPHDRFASVIYSADGKEIGRYFRNTGNRVYADFDEISQHVVDALIATEDSRFEEHSGIDGQALLRVMFKTILMGQKNAGGGSTITQQLAKQLYSPTSSNLFTRSMQKPIEWMIAVKLERYYSKEEILKMYLNQFDFLYNAVGIKSAASIYFNKTPEALTIEEAATLVGMVKNPSYYNPVRQPERTLERRNTVLSLMHKQGYLTAAELDSLSSLPLTLDFHRVDHKDGVAPYFREELRRILRAVKPEWSNYHSWERAKFLDDSTQWEINPLYGWIEKNPKPDGSKYDIYNDGLKIYTTIDTRMQQYAEEAVAEHLGGYLQPSFNRQPRDSRRTPYSTNRTELSEIRLNYLVRNAMKNTDRYRAMKKAGKSREEIEQSFMERREMKVFTYHGMVDTVMTPFDSLMHQKSFLRTGFMAMDPKNGHVLAYVGGPDFTAFQYDMVSTGRRQIGSTVKPFLYTYAMEENYTPCDMFSNTQPVITDENGKTWMPRSGRSRVGQMVDLRWALTNSNNWISARLISQLSPSALVRTMHNFGITGDLPAVMSLCLGPCDVSVKEMVTAYTAFANNGMRVDPIMVTAIADGNGNIISEFTPRHTEVISETAYYRILSMLLNVVDSGTARRLKGTYNLSGDIGGKTGTTNYNADGWFMGFTPQIVAGAWVGGEERYIHFNNMAYGQGSAMALPIWGKFMQKVFNDNTLPYNRGAKFEFPENVDLCKGEDYGTFWDESPDGEPETVESTIEDIFD